tara:strand:+ start:4491 stop:5378 length:888 start_codon:yes stop_codon:yes gene_type:complete
MVYTHDGPGDWRQFILREHIASLPVDEQRRAFLKEQYEFENFQAQQAFLQSNSLNSLNNQNHQGGSDSNKVVSATFGGTFTSISGNTTYVDVLFEQSVSIQGTGVPFIQIINGQQGGGTFSSFPYNYASGADSKTLRFTHVHPATPNNDGGAAAHVIAVGTDLSGGATGTIANGVANGYPGVPLTGVAGVSDIIADCILDGGGVLSSIIFLSQTTAAYAFKPGDVLTISAAALGSGGTGTITLTIAANDLTGDILTLVGTTLNEDGSEIYTTSSGPSVQTDLSYTSSSTLTLVAS